MGRPFNSQRAFKKTKEKLVNITNSAINLPLARKIKVFEIKQ